MVHTREWKRPILQSGREDTYSEAKLKTAMIWHFQTLIKGSELRHGAYCHSALWPSLLPFRAAVAHAKTAGNFLT